MTAATAHVFTYGSLMFDAVWSRVVAGTHASVAATLDGHARYAIDGETYPGMVEDAAARVVGRLYLDVEATDLARLDAFEGADYRRVPVVLRCDDGVERVGETYLFVAAERLTSNLWMPEGFRMDRFLETYCRDKLERE